MGKLPTTVIKKYWEEVTRLLVETHNLDPIKARNAVRAYWAMLKEAKIGYSVYHAPVAETAEGIINGGYVCEHKNSAYYGDTNPPTYKCNDCGITFVQGQFE